MDIKLFTMDSNLFYVIICYVLPTIILIYSLVVGFRLNRRSTTTRSSECIPDAKERMKLFNERKEALIKKARMMYLKKQQADATKLIE